MPPAEFECKQCGTCCQLVNIAYRVLITDEDVDRWCTEGRDDILAWIGSQRVHAAGDRGFIHVFPIHPLVPRLVEGHCPFLAKTPNGDKVICTIHDTKPIDCRAFPPARWAAERIGCPGFG